MGLLWPTDTADATVTAAAGTEVVGIYTAGRDIMHETHSPIKTPASLRRYNKCLLFQILCFFS